MASNGRCQLYSDLSVCGCNEDSGQDQDVLSFLRVQMKEVTVPGALRKCGNRRNMHATIQCAAQWLEKLAILSCSNCIFLEGRK